MIDIDKQVAYWREGALSDWEAAQVLLRRKLVWQGLFFMHLALEKALKAHVCRQTNELAPRTHDLVRLSRLAQLTLPEEQIDFLAATNAYNIEGRYPDATLPTPGYGGASQIMLRAKEVFEWLINRL